MQRSPTDCSTPLTRHLQYLPEITINHALMDTLSEEQKQEWVDADPRKTFRYNQLTRRVGSLVEGHPCSLHGFISAHAHWGASSEHCPVDMSRRTTATPLPLQPGGGGEPGAVSVRRGVLQ